MMYPGGGVLNPLLPLMTVTCPGWIEVDSMGFP